MLRTIAIAVLIGFVSTIAVAQQPTPSPSPAPGTRPNTEAAFDRYQQAQAEYDAVAANPNASLRDLDLAYYKGEAALTAALHALDDEVVKSRDVRDAKFAQEVAESTYERQKGKDLQTDHDNEKAIARARAEYERRFQARKEAIQTSMGQHLPWSFSRSARHYDLAEAKRKSDEAAAKKRWEEKKAQEQQKSEPKKTSCAPGTGLAGMTENIACQEQHSGASH